MCLLGFIFCSSSVLPLLSQSKLSQVLTWCPKCLLTGLPASGTSSTDIQNFLPKGLVGPPRSPQVSLTFIEQGLMGNKGGTRHPCLQEEQFVGVTAPPQLLALQPGKQSFSCSPCLFLQPCCQSLSYLYPPPWAAITPLCPLVSLKPLSKHHFLVDWNF